MRVQLHAAAEDELFHAAAWCEDQVSGLGSDFLAEIDRWLLLIVEAPGICAPWQNGYAESFNARFRDELVSTTLFWDLKEAKALTATWKEQYNLDRPHSALGYLAPAEFAERVTQGSAETV